MVEQRKLFKTKLCVLYQKGRCSRHSCSFAHGEAELRRFSSSASFHGRRESDLRDTIGRSYSPKRRYSPARDPGGRHALHEYSPSRAVGKESKRRKTEHLDDQSELSGSLRIPNEPEDEAKEASSVLQKQLKVVQSELNIIEQHRSQLEVYLGERSQEVGSLTSKIKELETQIYREKEECKRMSSKVKKFVKAHSRHSSLQDQLKRSQVRLNKLADQLGLDINGIDANGEDSSINIVSDGETDFPATLRNERLNAASPSKKSFNDNRDSAKEPKQAHSVRGNLTTTRTQQRIYRWNINPGQSNLMNENESMNNGIGSPRLFAKEDTNNKRKLATSSMLSADVLKSLESGPVVPSTSMAAHAVNTEIDTELDDKIENVENTSRVEGEPTYENGRYSLPLPPPPPFPPKHFSRIEGDDETVDIVNGV